MSRENATPKHMPTPIRVTTSLLVCRDFLELGIDQRNRCVKGATITRVDPLKQFRKFHEPDVSIINKKTIGEDGIYHRNHQEPWAFN